MSAPARLSCALASPLALALACALDVRGAAGPFGVAASAVLIGVVFSVGTLHGALWDFAFKALLRAPARVSAALWCVVSGALALTLAVELGAFARVGGAYRGLALSILVACGLGAPLFAGVLIAMQPTQTRPAGWISRVTPRTRALGVGALLLAAAACFVADRRLFVGLYPAAHLALQLGCLWLGMFALCSTLPAPAFVARIQARWLAPLAVGAITLGIAALPKVELSVLESRPFLHLAMQGARHLTDVDLDGYSGLLAGGDCAPFDPHVNPGAAEVPGNGIDDNCLLGDAKPSTATKQHFKMPSGPPPMDVVLITIDSLRPDHMGAYSADYGPRKLATTPELDAFAERGLVFDHAFTSGGWTSIAVSSLMRGVYARRMRWTRMFETTQFRLLRWSQQDKLRSGESIAKMFPLPLTDPHPTLAEWLSRREMQTLAVVNDEFSELLSRDSGVANGFLSYREVDDLPKNQRDDEGTATLAIRSIAAVPAGQHFFLWVHFFGPHSPNVEHKGVRLDGPDIVQGYDHEIRFADQQVGRLLRAIEERPEPTAVFVAADHGEEFMGDSRHHGYSLEEAAIRIPLIARVPGWGQGRDRRPVSLVDLMPTILRLTETPAPSGLDGVALQDGLGAAPGKARVMYADTWQYDRLGRLIRAYSAAFDGRTKAMFDPLLNAWTYYEPSGGKESIRPVTPRSPIALVRKLSGYVESNGGTVRLSY